MNNSRISPTKGNLLACKKSLVLANTGYELMDKKRNVLVREMMALVDRVKDLRETIITTYAQAYEALQYANMSLGVVTIIANAVPIEDTVTIRYRSVMGVEIPHVSIKEVTELSLPYGFAESNSNLDEAYLLLLKAKQMTCVLAEIDNSVFRLAKAIQKTQKRANALKNIVIPSFTNSIKYISDALEEKDREQFTSLKVIKNQKQKKATVS